MPKKVLKKYSKLPVIAREDFLRFYRRFASFFALKILSEKQQGKEDHGKGKANEVR